MAASASEVEKKPIERVDNRPPFDPFDTTRVKHSKVGIWDLYEEIQPPRPVFLLPRLFGRDQFNVIRRGVPPFLQLIKEILKIPGMWRYLLADIVLTIIQNTTPAWKLWYSSKLLVITQQALETRTYDALQLRSTIMGSLITVVVYALSSIASTHVKRPIEEKVESLAAWKVLKARMRLDYPTAEDPAIQRQFDDFADPAAAWRAVSTIIGSAGTFLQLATQMVVLSSVLRREPAMLICAICDCIPYLSWSSRNLYWSSTTWAATTREGHYKTIRGISKLVGKSEHRKEVIAGNLQSFLATRWKTAMDTLGGVGSDFMQSYHRASSAKFHWHDLFSYWSQDMSQVVLLIQVIRNPASLPSSYAALALSRQVAKQLSESFMMLKYSSKSLGEQFNIIRRLASLPEIPNLVVDGTVPFPENTQDLKNGVSVEFRDVSFTYPGSDSFALEKASFKIEKGQLCVIVGTNGSGKSTLLKLLLRLYDPQEGMILIDGVNIKNFRIADIRNAISALFQDFTIFPLSIKENIGMGDPSHSEDTDRIARASELGGSTSIIEKLPNKFDSYLDSPVMNHYSNLPEGTLSLFGHKKLNAYGQSRGWSCESHDLSGGEKQRLALSRSFMRHLDEDNGVAMLLFDEPSASLDPEAEYLLFERLRKLRGSKTMLFSSHRFGNLTRHADLILFMKESHVVEHGNHSELLTLNGGYASMYNMQAAAFREDVSK